MLRSKIFIIFNIILLVVFCSNPAHSQTQKRGFAPPGMDRGPQNPVRAFLNKFSVNLATGYGQTFYKHKPENFQLLNKNNELFLYPGDTAGGYFRNWLDKPTFVNEGVDDGSLIENDSTGLHLEGKGNNIPINLSIYYNLNRLRIGGGTKVIFHNPGTLLLQNQQESSGAAYNFANDKYVFYNYYALVGLSAYEIYDWAFGADVRVGMMKMGSKFDQPSINRGYTINTGISIEKVFSEYFRVFVRPSYEFKNYTMDLPNQGGTVDVNDPAVFLEIGVSINYPEIPRSPIKNDEVRMKHRIDGKEFRGMPFYKKQNPKYGELYPELQRDKLKGESNRQVKKGKFKSRLKSWFPFLF